MEEDIKIEGEPRVYEVSFLLNPALREEEASIEMDAIKDAIGKDGGVILFEGSPKVMSLAYTMFKVVANKRHIFESAYFNWFKFTLPQEKITDIKNFFEGKETIIRFLIIKTIKEAPAVLRRQAPRRVVPRKVEKEEPREIDEAQLDKEIEELLTSS